MADRRVIDMRPFGNALLAALVVSLAGCGPAGLPTAQPSSAGICIADLPGEEARPQPLPADRAVGRGTLIYRPCPDCGAWLVTETGDRYEAPPPPAPPKPTAPLPDASPLAGPPPLPLPPDPMFGLRLSPDGRWLAQLGFGGLLLRDLAGTEVRRVGGGFPGAWSADGRLLVVDSPQRVGTDSGTTELVEVTTGKRRPVHLPWGQVLAVLGPDEVLAARGYNRENGDADPSRETYAVVDPASGTIRREITVDSGRQTRSHPDATIAMGNLLVSVISSTDRSTEEILAVAVDSGRVIGRHPLPADAPGGYPAWRVAGISGRGVVLERRVNIGSPTPLVEPLQLVLMDPVTGKRGPSCTLPARSQVILPR